MQYSVQIRVWMFVKGYFLLKVQVKIVVNDKQKLNR